MIFIEADVALGLIRAAFGGLVTLRDRGGLESALYRPKAAVFYASASVYDAAAFLAESICQAHPFCDGNKRSAWLLCASFLDKNGLLVLPPSSEQVQAVMVDVADGKVSVNQLSFFLRGLCREK